MTEQPHATDPVSVVPAGVDFTIRRTTDEDKPWMRQLLRQFWATDKIVSRGRLHDAVELEALAAFEDEHPIGLLIYTMDDEACEIVAFNSLNDSGGVGSCLLAAVRNEARARGCTRLWLVTTNDNTPAIRFYQRRDFEICAFHKDAITEARGLKPEIPDQGLDGIHIKHEIEMEYML